MIKSCQFTDNKFYENLILIQTENVILLQDKDKAWVHNNVVIFEDCTFYNNNPTNSWNFISMLDAPDVHIKDCVFYNST